MGWNPKSWFGRKGKAGKEEAPAPTTEPTTPVAPPTTPPTTAGEEKKPSRWRRLTDRLRGKPKEEAPPAPPEAPPAPPEAPAEAPPTPPTPPEEAPPEREYPSSIHVEADGDWRISSTDWSGLMKGNVHGHKAKVFIDAYEKGEWNTCVQMVADAWDVNVANQIIPEQSTVDYINWH